MRLRNKHVDRDEEKARKREKEREREIEKDVFLFDDEWMISGGGRICIMNADWLRVWI